MRFYGKKVAIIISLPNESVQAWLECKLIMIFISDNLIVVLQFGNLCASALQSTVHVASSLWRIQETGKGGSKLSSAERAKFGVTPTFGAVKLGKIPFSARGSPILDCVNCCEQSTN